MSFFEWLGNFVRDLWPFREVAPWDRGVYVVCNRWIFDVGPGVYFVVPWFVEISSACVVPTFFWSPLMTITLMDGRALSFSVSAEVCVVDARAAVLRVSDYRESVTEAVSSVVSEELSETDPEALSTLRGRRAVLRRVAKAANEAVARFGVEVRGLRFANFAFVRTYRLLNESATVVHGI